MNTDQEERAAYQRAVETAKNELTDLRRRAEQAEALALTLQQQRDQADASVIALREALALDQARLEAAWAVAEAARAYVQAGEYDDLASLLLELKDKVARWKG